MSIKWCTTLTVHWTGNLTAKWNILPWTHEIPPWVGIPPRLGTTALNLKPKREAKRKIWKVWIFVQHLLQKRNSQSWEPNRKALAYESWNMSVTLRCRCWLIDKLSALSELRHVRRIRNYYLDAETSNGSSVFIARGYLRSNTQNRHPFHDLPKSMVNSIFFTITVTHQ